ncbi:hypothetical protein NXS19_004311 [Fusarium pseudograminearum]|nr:hypothetical protein NXS19_004311 [Fusarium pseudograminearum]
MQVIQTGRSETESLIVNTESYYSGRNGWKPSAGTTVSLQSLTVGLAPTIWQVGKGMMVKTAFDPDTISRSFPDASSQTRRI